jgi:hypothetical protein
VTTLTPRRERFAQEYVKHGNASEAYRVAFPKAREWAQEAQNVAGAKMLAVGSVEVRVAELRQQTERKAGWTRAAWIAHLTHEANTGTRSSDRIRALAALGKALGYCEPEKVVGKKVQSIVVVGAPRTPPTTPLPAT